MIREVIAGEDPRGSSRGLRDAQIDPGPWVFAHLSHALAVHRYAAERRMP